MFRTRPPLPTAPTAARAIAGLALVALTACGGDEPPPRVEPTEPTTGGEAVLEPSRPTGPPASYVSDAHRVVVRIDMDAVRGSALSTEIASLVRSYPTWRALLGNSGIDPVRDFDRVLVTAQGVVTDRSVILIRHRLSNARVREAVLSMAVDRGERPAWREVSGLSVVDWPAETDVPRVVVLTGEQEMVVTTPDELDRVIEVALDHAARREGGDELVEPALTLEEGVIATVVAEELTEESRRRFRHAPDAFAVAVRRDGDGGSRVVLEAHGTYADEESAETARRYYTQQRDHYAGQMLVRAVGLDRPLREASIESNGNTVDVSASLSEDEIQRVFGLVALGQLSGG
jgi:hypothetical protein